MGQLSRAEEPVDRHWTVKVMGAEPLVTYNTDHASSSSGVDSSYIIFWSDSALWSSEKSIISRKFSPILVAVVPQEFSDITITSQQSRMIIR
jgi:hypothetical protein